MFQDCLFIISMMFIIVLGINSYASKTPRFRGDNVLLFPEKLMPILMAFWGTLTIFTLCLWIARPASSLEFLIQVALWVTSSISTAVSFILLFEKEAQTA